MVERGVPRRLQLPADVAVDAHQHPLDVRNGLVNLLLLLQHLGVSALPQQAGLLQQLLHGLPLLLGGDHFAAVRTASGARLGTLLRSHLRISLMRLPPRVLLWPACRVAVLKQVLGLAAGPGRLLLLVGVVVVLDQLVQVFLQGAHQLLAVLEREGDELMAGPLAQLLALAAHNVGLPIRALHFYDEHEHVGEVLRLGDGGLHVLVGLERGRAVEQNQAHELGVVVGLRPADGLEDGHEAVLRQGARQVVDQELVRLGLQELDQLLGLEGAVVVHCQLELVLLGLRHQLL